jgi:biopolymer transport protein ExbD/biopolymer transport protein TolR
MAFLRKQTEAPRVDLTPMVDVVFLLLIFFMISTTFIETPGLSIKLPESSAQAIDREPKELKIFLSSEGEIFHGESSLTLKEFKSLLRGYRAAADQTTFLLMADKDARHGIVVSLMDLARDAGFLKLAIATEHKDRSK